jgi:hypothetical protein
MVVAPALKLVVPIAGVHVSEATPTLSVAVGAAQDARPELESVMVNELTSLGHWISVHRWTQDGGKEQRAVNKFKIASRLQVTHTR